MLDGRQLSSTVDGRVFRQEAVFARYADNVRLRAAQHGYGALSLVWCRVAYFLLAYSDFQQYSICTNVHYCNVRRRDAPRAHAEEPLAVRGPTHAAHVACWYRRTCRLSHTRRTSPRDADQGERVVYRLPHKASETQERVWNLKSDCSTRCGMSYVSNI